MISAELAAHPISTKRGLTALCRRASHRGISYYIRYETQTYSLTAIGLLFTVNKELSSPKSAPCKAPCSPAACGLHSSKLYGAAAKCWKDEGIGYPAMLSSSL